jgi:Family of unknown function (DUF695)
MRFLRREPSQPVAPVDFWSWWAETRDPLAEAITGRTLAEQLVRQISAAVSTIHPAMAWELAKGTAAEQAFCVSPEGNAELRILALRWLASAPPADATWEYHASKQAQPLLATTQVAGWTVDLAEMRTVTTWDARSRLVDVRLWHPRFEGLPRNVRQQIVFVFLDSLLGEDDVERWVGRIDLLDAAGGGLTPDELAAEVRGHAAEPPSDESWILGQGQGPDGPVIVMGNAALKRIDHPFADQHVAVRVVLEGERGLPDDAEAAALNAEEDDLVRRLEGIAVYAGRTTKPGLRTMHFVAEDLDRVKATIDAWAVDLPPRKIKVGLGRDVAWSFRRELGLG